MKKVINISNAAKPIGPYNQAIKYGNMLFTSGQVAINTKGEFLNDSIEPETHQVFENIIALLKEEGMALSNVVKVSIFLKDMKDFEAVNHIYSDYFSGTDFPARETVQVAKLPKDARIEISVIAGE
jgi:2-iminobutanoate/2-iminopropanoate deaminase